MNIVQSIENAREENVGSHGVGADVLKTALTRAEVRLDWLRARHADRSCLCCAYRKPTATSR